jgi:diaminopimelate decarboxylase
VELPDLEPGSVLALGMAGAYGFTEAMTPFLSHPAPREVWEA